MKKFKVGDEVLFNGKTQKISSIIQGEIDYKKPNMQNGVLFSGYHRKPKKYKLDNGIEVYGKTLKKQETNKSDGYNFNRPFWAQDLGDEWDDYVFTADDF